MSKRKEETYKYDADGNFLLMPNGPSLSYDKIEKMFDDLARVLANPADSPNYYIKLSPGNPLFQVPKGKLIISMNFESYEDYCERIDLQKKHRVLLKPKYQKLNCEQIMNHVLCACNYAPGKFPYLK